MLPEVNRLAGLSWRKPCRSRSFAKMATQQLCEPEREGVVSRTVLLRARLKVEYGLAR